VQFTYGPRAPLPPETIAALGLSVNKGHKIWANLPPATVYRLPLPPHLISVYHCMPY
jgi:phosphatidylethanolamine/phosphatidyl-N-methylethanolamine N-methyltransferase